MTATTSTLASKMHAVMAAIDVVAKRGENQQQGYNYVKATDVAREVRSELVKVGVAFTLGVNEVRTELISRDPKPPFVMFIVQGVASFIDTVSGESLLVPFAGSGGDYGGEKGLYKAITGGLKYLLRATFLIPDEEDPEVPMADGAGETGASITLIGGDVGVAEPNKGLSDRQKALLRGRGRELGIVDAAWKAFVLAVTGKQTSKDLDVSDFEHLVFIMQADNPDKVATLAPFQPGGLLDGATEAPSADATVA